LRSSFFYYAVLLLLVQWAAVPADAAEPRSSPRSQPQLQLKTNKVLVTPRVYRQIFEPYLYPQGPIFITSDAVLAGFNTLMTESFRRFERLNAQRLPEILSLIWSRLNAEKKESEKSARDTGTSGDDASNDAAAETLQQIKTVRENARRYARFVVAVALTVLDRDPPGLDPELQAPVNAFQKYLLSGRPAPGAQIPAGGLDAAHLATERSEPRGFYRQTEDLQRYFRAVGWLQTARFRIESDEELLAILILGKVTSASHAGKPSDVRRIENYFRCYRELIGRSNDRDVLLAGQIVRDRPADLRMVREYLARIDTEQNRIGIGEGRFPSSNEPPGQPGGAFTVMSPGRRFDRLLFETLASEKAPSAEGIALCGALGSNYARREWTRHLAPDIRERRLGILEQMASVLPDVGLYDQYLSCLGSLADTVEPDAPLFMFTDAWEIKNCNTVLSGWVQAHRIPQTPMPPETARGTEVYGALPQGFVEPEPEFFARLGELVDHSREVLERCAVFVPPRKVLAADLRGFLQLVEQGRYPPEDPASADFPPDRQISIDRCLKVLRVLGNLRLPPPDQPIGAETLDRIRDLAADIANGFYADDPTYQGLIIETNVDLDQIWRILGRLCRRLEVMAHKQLRGVAFTEKESYFLADFGLRLATVMLQGGGGLRPLRDDFPTLLTIPGTGTAADTRAAAVGRPRELLVLYPVHGREILCRGAVVPYYEATLAQPLTPEEWVRRLDSDERPLEPRWVKPLFAPGPIEKDW
jgi:hypothetical protein